jgi:hypothetical protein
MVLFEQAKFAVHGASLLVRALVERSKRMGTAFGFSRGHGKAAHDVTFLVPNVTPSLSMDTRRDRPRPVRRWQRAAR